jgi:AcrR family transcriptional regulator
MTTRSSVVRARPRSRRGEGETLREDLLDATELLMIETGSADAVSIRAIADAVGVTPPSIYLHFPDKESLILAVCERHF